MFDLRRTLPKYLITFLHENVVLGIGITDQSDYSIYYLLVRHFIRTLREKKNPKMEYLLKTKKPRLIADFSLGHIFGWGGIQEPS